MLASVAWSGAGDAVLWSDASNWSGGRIPQAGDQVTIAATNVEQEIVVDVATPRLLSLSVELAAQQQFRIDQTTIQADQAIDFSGGQFTLRDATLRTPELNLEGSTSLHGIVQFQTSLAVNHGALRVVADAEAGATLAITGNFENRFGLVTVTSNVVGNARLATDGTISNSGVIIIEPGAGGGRQVLGAVVNEGAIEVQTPTRFDAPFQQITNDGLFDVYEGVELEVAAGKFVSLFGDVLGNRVSFIDTQIEARFFESSVALTNSRLEPVALEVGLPELLVIGGLEVDADSSVRLDVFETSGGLQSEQLRVLGPVSFSGRLELVPQNVSTPHSCQQLTVPLNGIDAGVVDLSTFVFESGRVGRSRHQADELVVTIVDPRSKINFHPERIEVDLNADVETPEYQVCLSAPEALISDVLITPQTPPGVNVDRAAIQFDVQKWDAVETLTVSVDPLRLPTGRDELHIEHRVESDDVRYRSDQADDVTPGPVSVQLANAPQLGDFDSDGIIQLSDLEHLCGSIYDLSLLEPGQQPRLDLNLDGEIDRRDLDFMVQDLLGTNYGDTDLNGIFDSTDLIEALKPGLLEVRTRGLANWSSGDWNCDGWFDSTDLIDAFKTGTYVLAAIAIEVTKHDEDRRLRNRPSNREINDQHLPELSYESRPLV